MKITNCTKSAIIAFGIHSQYGYGDDVKIEIGETKDVSGPYIGEMGEGECYIALFGDIVCHDGHDDETGFQVVKDNPLCLQLDDHGVRGVTVRHHEDDPESHVTKWRSEHVSAQEAQQTSYHGHEAFTLMNIETALYIFISESEAF